MRLKIIAPIASCSAMISFSRASVVNFTSGRPRRPYPTVEADDFQMPANLIAVAIVDLLDHTGRPLSGIADLQVSDGGIDP